MATRTSIIIVDASVPTGSRPSWFDHEMQQFQKDFIKSTGGCLSLINNLKVQESTPNANTVDLLSGQAYIEITKNSTLYKVRLDNLATVVLNISANVSGNPRIDKIVARIDVATEPDVNAANIGLLEVVEGTPAGSPTAPATPANAIELATVSVLNGQTVFANSDITDTRSIVSIDSALLTDLTKSDLGLGNVQDTLSKFDATANPAVTDDSGDGYSIGSIWVNVTGGASFICVDSTVGSAIWKETTIIPTQQLVTVGETIDGTTTPQAVHISDGTGTRTQGSFYKSDSDDLTNRANRFEGFLKGNKTATDTDILYLNGVVDGFTGLTVGEDYFVSTTAGGISTTETGLKVGIAISATEILIDKKTGFSDRVQGGSSSSLSIASTQALTDGFLFGALLTHQSNTSVVVTVFSDSSATPTTQLAKIRRDNTLIYNHNFCIPVKKGNYYSTNAAASGTYTGIIYWQPTP